MSNEWTIVPCSSPCDNIGLDGRHRARPVGSLSQRRYVISMFMCTCQNVEASILWDKNSVEWRELVL